MRKIRSINGLKGRVKKVSKDKTQITVSLFKGGTVVTKNAGFEKGDRVCLITNSITNKVIKTIPETVANIIRTVGSSPFFGSLMVKEVEDIPNINQSNGENYGDEEEDGTEYTNYICATREKEGQQQFGVTFNTDEELE